MVGIFSSFLDSYVSFKSDDEGKAFAEKLKVDKHLEELTINQMTTESGKAIAEALTINQTLKSLRISELSDDGYKVFAGALKVNRVLEKFSLGDNVLKEAECKAFVEMLEVNVALKDLTLNLGSGYEGVKMIAGGLKLNRSLQKLRLSFFDLRYEGGKALADALRVHKLKELDLVGRINDEKGCQELVEGIKTNHFLQKLILRFDMFGSAGGKAFDEALKVNDTLQELTLACALLDQGGLEIAEGIKVNSVLRKLKLTVYNGGKAFAEALKVNKGLRELSYHSFEDGGKAFAEALKVNQFLERLDLGHNKISIDGIKVFGEALTANSTLRVLSMYYTGLLDDGGKAIGEALKGNRGLKSLDLGSNEIGDEGGRAIALALQGNRVLKKLRLGRNLIGDEGGKAFSEMLKVNDILKALDLSGNRLTNKAGMGFAAAFKVNRSLADLELDLSGNKMSEDSLKGIQSSKDMAKEEKAQEESAKKIQAIAPDLFAKESRDRFELTLVSQHLREIDGLVIANTLKSNPILKRLELSRNNLGYAGIKAIAEALKTNEVLQVINLGYNSLTFGKLDDWIYQESLRKRTGRPSLLEDTAGIAVGEALKSNTVLQVLSLRENRLEDVGGKVIGEALADNYMLQELDLSVNRFSEETGVAFGKALRANRMLHILSLNNNAIGDRGARAIAEGLTFNDSIKVINLSECRIGVEGGKAIAEGLKHNGSLSYLSLSNNEVGDKGGEALAEALKANRTLRTLYLNNNKIQGEGGQAIGNSLKENRVLRFLSLVSNQIGREGSKAIGDALQINDTLRHLNLDRNNINDEGARMIAEGVKRNHSLYILSLGENLIGNEGGKAFAEALKVNTALWVLELTRNRIGLEGGEAIANTFQMNLARWVFLNFNEGNEAEQVIGKALEGNLTQEVRDKIIEIHSLGAALQGLQQGRLQALEIGDYEGGGDEKEKNTTWGMDAIKSLRNNHHLKDLTIINAHFHTKGGDEIGTMLRLNQTLQTLRLCSVNLGVAGCLKIAEAIKDNKTLQELSLEGNLINGEEGGKAVATLLRNSSALVKLNLRMNHLGEKGAREIAAGIADNKNLQSLNLSYTGLGANGGLEIAKSLQGNKTLQELNLAGNRLIGEQGGKVIGEVLKGALKALNIRNNNIGDEGIKAFAPALESTELQALDMSHCGLSYIEGPAIGRALQFNRKLKVLKLAFNDLGDKGSREIELSFKQNWSLTELDLSHNNLSDPILKRLEVKLQPNKEFLETLHALRSNHRTLTEVNLDNKRLDDKGGEALADALRSNRLVRVLRIGNNQLHDEGGKALFSMLEKNWALTELDYSRNFISPVMCRGIDAKVKSNKEFQALLKRIKSNDPALTQLDLVNKKLDTEAGRLIAEAIKGSRALRVLRLEDNHLENKGGQAIDKALSSNQTLTDLTLANNHIDEKIQASIDAKVKRNRDRNETQVSEPANEEVIKGDLMLREYFNEFYKFLDIKYQKNRMGNYDINLLDRIITPISGLIKAAPVVGDVVGSSINYVANGLNESHKKEQANKFGNLFSSDEEQSKTQRRSLCQRIAVIRRPMIHALDDGAGMRVLADRIPELAKKDFEYFVSAVSGGRIKRYQDEPALRRIFETTENVGKESNPQTVYENFKTKISPNLSQFIPENTSSAKEWPSKTILDCIAQCFIDSIGHIQIDMENVFPGEIKRGGERLLAKHLLERGKILGFALNPEDSLYHSIAQGCGLAQKQNCSVKELSEAIYVYGIDNEDAVRVFVRQTEAKEGLKERVVKTGNLILDRFIQEESGEKDSLKHMDLALLKYANYLYHFDEEKGKASVAFEGLVLCRKYKFKLVVHSVFLDRTDKYDRDWQARMETEDLLDEEEAKQHAQAEEANWTFSTQELGSDEEKQSSFSIEIANIENTYFLPIYDLALIEASSRAAQSTPIALSRNVANMVSSLAQESSSQAKRGFPATMGIPTNMTKQFAQWQAQATAASRASTSAVEAAVVRTREAFASATGGLATSAARLPTTAAEAAAFAAKGTR